MMPPAPSDSTRLIWLLRRAFHSVEAEKERRLRSTGVTPANYAVLINVKGSPGLTSAELARKLQVTPQNIAGLIAKLDAVGWVERVEHPRHRHVRELHLTGPGEEALLLADAVVARLETDIRGSLSQQEVETLAADLLRVEQVFG